MPFADERMPLNGRYRTPNTERLASEGMKSPNSYSNAVWTPPDRSWAVRRVPHNSDSLELTIADWERPSNRVKRRVAPIETRSAIADDDLVAILGSSLALGRFPGQQRDIHCREVFRVAQVV